MRLALLVEPDLVGPGQLALVAALAAVLVGPELDPVDPDSGLGSSLVVVVELGVVSGLVVPNEVQFGR